MITASLGGLAKLDIALLIFSFSLAATSLPLIKMQLIEISPYMNLVPAVGLEPTTCRLSGATGYNSAALPLSYAGAWLVRVEGIEPTTL